MTINTIIQTGLARSNTSAACSEPFQIRQLYAVDVRRRRARLDNLRSIIADEIADKLSALRYAQDWAYREGEFAPRRGRLTHTA